MSAVIRSLRVRLLVAMVCIAVGAVAATAWLISQGTARNVRDDVERALETDGRIYEELLSFAETHPDWDGVDELVRRLSSETGRRIALTTRRGKVLADSAELEGRNARLPRRPAAEVDPFDIGVTVGGEISLGAEAMPVDEPRFPFTDDELAERRQIADAGVACMATEGAAAEVFEDAFGVSVEPTDEDSWDDDAWLEAYEGCIDDDDLVAPSAAEVDHYNLEAQRTLECLQAEGVEATSDSAPDGSIAVEVDWDDPVVSSAYDRCYSQAQRAVNDPYVADPALLYLGERNEPPSWNDAGSGRTLLAAAVVALLTIALAVAVSRRLLRPVAALTGAAQRMATGSLGERVDERGRDELAGLAHAFNVMADAVESNEEQRRRLVSDVAHELRTPLANIRGYVEAAQDGVTPPDAALLESLHEEALLLQHVIDDLQTLSLAESDRLPLHREQLDLGELAEQVVAAYRVLAAGAEVDLVYDPPDGEALVDADPLRLRQAVGNLVSNAIRYTPAGGRITVRVRPSGRDGDGDEVALDVVDSGIGISPENLPHVFDRFWRADASRTRDTGGSGLGLAITRQLVQRHGGRVAATSTPGEGSTFTILLPVVGL